jgi:hypothetical protein
VELGRGIADLAVVYNFTKLTKKGLDFVSGAQTCQFCQFLAVKCEKFGIFPTKLQCKK